MEKNEILTVLNDWNFWRQDLDCGLPRDFYLRRLQDFLLTNQILVITGARRSGKSYLMRQMAKSLIKQGTAREEILMVNFEDPRWVGLNAQLLQRVYETYQEALRPQNPPFVFLDEVQEVKDWEKWARTMHELKKAKIILSGSNAKLLGQELGTLLTGRHLDLTVFPLSFDEFLQFNGVEIQDHLDLVNKRVELKTKLRDFMEQGGFPEVVLAKKKKETLLLYFDDVLNKDLVRRYWVRKPERLKSLAKYYLSNPATLTTFTSLGKTLSVSTDTIEKYSSFLETAFLTFFVKRHSFKVKEQEKSPRKLYVIDTGLANAVGFRFSENLGRLAENLVFLKLLKEKTLNSNLELFYWKDASHREVDFLVKKDLEIKSLIQVCWDLSNLETKKREIKSLLKAADELKLSEGLILTEDYENKESIEGKTINFFPLARWLLAK